MNRREFTRKAALGTVAGGALSGAALEASGFLQPGEGGNSANADSTISFKLSVMLWTVFTKLPFEQRLEKVASAGYSNVELVGEFKHWSDQDYNNALQTKRRLAIQFDATAGVERSLTNPAERDAFLSEVKNMLPIMEKLECPKLIVLTGDKVPGMSHEAQHASCVEGLKRAAELMEGRNFKILLENIDPEENPKYFLTSVTEGFQVIREVNHPQVKFLYDFFHEQISEGNLIEKMVKNISLVDLFHIADVPGRHEPGTGEINYGSIYRKMAELGYDRYIAMEFLPTRDPVESLKAAREMALSAGQNRRA
jgi:hydroxypyruvate isomerase